MSDEVIEKFDLEVFDKKNETRNVISFHDKNVAVKNYKRFKLLYKDLFIVSLTYTKSYIQYPVKN